MVRVSASGSEGRGFAPWPRHTKSVKNGTGSSLADARNKRVVIRIYKNADRYLLLVMSQKKLYRVYVALFQNAKLNKASLSLSFFSKSHSSIIIK